MAEHWTITIPDGDFAAYVARPSTPGPWPAVVAIQEIFGINHVMREVCAWLAGQGYLAVCPDLFWRLEAGVDITDKSQPEWDKALDLMGRFDVDRGVDGHPRRRSTTSAATPTAPARSATSATAWAASSPSSPRCAPTRTPRSATTAWGWASTSTRRATCRAR